MILKLLGGLKKNRKFSKITIENLIILKKKNKSMTYIDGNFQNIFVFEKKLMLTIKSKTKNLYTYALKRALNVAKGI